MNRHQVAAELRKAQAGTVEEQRLALARIKLARARVNQAKGGRTTAGYVRRVDGEARGGPPMNAADAARELFADWDEFSREWQKAHPRRAHS